MAKVVTVVDGLLACEDCAVAIANDDYSGMDDAVEARVRAGIARLSRTGWLVIGDEAGFRWRGCDCCQDGLGGDKHGLSVMSTEV